MGETQDADLMITALELLRRDAENYSTQYDGDINHDLQVLADESLRTIEWLKSDRSGPIRPLSDAFEDAVGHC